MIFAFPAPIRLPSPPIPHPSRPRSSTPPPSTHPQFPTSALPPCKMEISSCFTSILLEMLDNNEILNVMSNHASKLKITMPVS